MTSHDVSCDFPVGTLVTVESRTWAGINKPGGTGKVIKSFIDAEGVPRVDVKYVIKGTERNIELEWVKKQQFLGRSNRRRKQDTPFIQEQSEIIANDQHKKVKKIALNHPIPKKKRRIKKNQAKTVQSKQKDPEIVLTPPAKEVRKVQDDLCDDKFDASIPREITIVSCCTSAGSLSCQDILTNTNRAIKTNRIANNRGRKTKKYLEEQAKSNRKMTEFFTSSTSQPLKNHDKLKEFLIHKDISTPTSHQKIDKDHNDYHRGTNTIPKSSTVTFNSTSKNIHSKISASTKIKSDATTSKRPLLPHNANTSHAIDTGNKTKKSGITTTLVTPAKMNEKFLASSTCSKDAQTMNREEKTTVEDTYVNEERLKIFTALFSHLYRHDMDGEIKLGDLISEVNKQMIVKAKFGYDEVVALVKELDKKGRVMFNIDDEVIYII